MIALNRFASRKLFRLTNNKYFSTIYIQCLGFTYAVKSSKMKGHSTKKTLDSFHLYVMHRL